MFISHQAAQLYTVNFGSGSRTILAHGGWTGSWELWTGPFQTLSKTWRTVAYDHRGTGATIAPVDSISMETMVQDLFAVMDQMEISTCVLAAESAGAIIAVTAILQQPQRFDGLVLVDALLHKEKDAGDAAFIQGLKTDLQATYDSFVNACVPASEANCQEIRSWGRKILARATSDSAVKLLECTFGVDLRPELPRISVPTLILHGEHDVIVPLIDSQEAASRIPNSQLHVFNDTGHVPTMTRPNEVADLINQFFSKS